MDAVDIVRGDPYRFVAQITVLDDGVGSSSGDGGDGDGDYGEKEKYLFENSCSNTIK